MFVKKNLIIRDLNTREILIFISILLLAEEIWK
jgi:hypothetical protein